MNKEHLYRVNVEWTGNTGTGTLNYRSYERSHTISAEHKPIIKGSSDPAFRGDAVKYNPEELLLASLSSCHMLWFLHLCTDHQIVVTAYTDKPVGIMIEDAQGGRFKEVTLNPDVMVSDASMITGVEALHAEAHRHCFIANSVNFPVKNISICQAENKIKS